MPFLIFWATLTGQPVMIVIMPGELPVISQPAPTPAKTVEATGNCYALVCAS